MLKQATEYPLHKVYFYKPFNVFTDASSFSISVAVTHCDAGETFPGGFFQPKINGNPKKVASN